MGGIIARGCGRTIPAGAQKQPESSTLELAGLSESLAEHVLAATWCVLEQHALSTPILEVRTAANLIELRLSFGSADDRELVEQKLLEDPEFAMALEG